jgi:hypothetical protein
LLCGSLPLAIHIVITATDARHPKTFFRIPRKVYHLKALQMYLFTQFNLRPTPAPFPRYAAGLPAAAGRNILSRLARGTNYEDVDIF